MERDYTKPIFFVLLFFAFILIGFLCKVLSSVLIPVAIAIFMALAFYPVFAIGALGAGDIKLMAVCAGFFDGSRALYFIFFSLLAAAAGGVALMIVKGQMKKRMQRLVMYIKRYMETGLPERYHADRGAERESGIAMAGAMFVSAVLGIGGLY